MNEHGGAIQVRPLLSGRRLYAVAEQEPEGLNNADECVSWLLHFERQAYYTFSLLFSLDDAEVEHEDQILSMAGVHALPYQCITREASFLYSPFFLLMACRRPLDRRVLDDQLPRRTGSRNGCRRLGYFTPSFPVLGEDNGICTPCIISRLAHISYARYNESLLHALKGPQISDN